MDSRRRDHNTASAAGQRRQSTATRSKAQPNGELGQRAKAMALRGATMPKKVSKMLHGTAVAERFTSNYLSLGGRAAGIDIQELASQYRLTRGSGPLATYM